LSILLLPAVVLVELGQAEQAAVAVVLVVIALVSLASYQAGTQLPNLYSMLPKLRPTQ
jgi:hypothetical protein